MPTFKKTFIIEVTGVAEDEATFNQELRDVPSVVLDSTRDRWQDGLRFVVASERTQRVDNAT